MSTDLQMSLAPGPAQSDHGLGTKQACDGVIYCSSELNDFSFVLRERMISCTHFEYVEHLNREVEGHMLPFSAPFPRRE